MPENQDIAISVEGLGKVYRIGARKEYNMITDAIAGLFTAPARHFRRLLQPSLAGRKGPVESTTPLAENDERDDILWALRDVSFHVKQGEVMGVIGRNGAGKSTLLKILSQITDPTEGEIQIRGRVGSLLEVGTGFHPELTGRDNVFLNGAVLGMTRREIRTRFDDIVAFAEVERFIDTPVKHYSSGMAVRLAFAVAAHLQPEILLIDEVLAVGDMAFQKKCLGKMGDVSRSGRTILFVSHNMAAIAQLTERCLVLDKGQVTFCGPTDQAIQHYVLLTQAKPTVSGRRPIDEIGCEKRILVNDKIQFVELGFAPGQDVETRIGESLRIEALLHAKEAVDPVSFGFTVRDEFGAPILNGYSPPFSMSRPGRHLRELEIRHANLAPGSYELCMSVQSGGLNETKYLYDIVLGFGRFTVTPFFEDFTPLREWHRGSWGTIIHRDSETHEKLLT